MLEEQEQHELIPVEQTRDTYQHTHELVTCLLASFCLSGNGIYFSVPQVGLLRRLCASSEERH
jgi:hypothetical protein